MFYTAYVYAEGKRWLAEFPDAPGCQTFADSMDELRADAREALEGWLEVHLVKGKAPPRPGAHRRAPKGMESMEVHISPSLAAALGIRWARQDRGMTQGDLAKLIDVSQQQVAALENPDKNPTLASIERAAKALGLNLELSFTPARSA